MEIKQNGSKWGFFNGFFSLFSCLFSGLEFPLPFFLAKGHQFQESLKQNNISKHSMYTILTYIWLEFMVNVVVNIAYVLNVWDNVFLRFQIGCDKNRISDWIR